MCCSDCCRVPRTLVFSFLASSSSSCRSRSPPVAAKIASDDRIIQAGRYDRHGRAADPANDELVMNFRVTVVPIAQRPTDIDFAIRPVGRLLDRPPTAHPTVLFI